jgi:5'-nucleotidase/UDP-sugar diphosphatase
MFKKWIMPAAFLLAFAVIIGCAGGAKSVEREVGKTYSFVLLHTNDHHGTTVAKDGQGGLAERISFIKSIRGQYPQTLLLDAGDINTGAALSNMFKAEPDILAYNIIGYDAGVLGNHEFDNGYEALKKQLPLFKYPIVNANIAEENGNLLPGTVPYIIKEFDGIRVGIFGLTTKRTEEMAHVDGIQFLDEIESAKKIVPILLNDEKVDIVIALTHIGDVKESETHVTSPELAAAIPEIDFIVDGHSHSFMEEPILVGETEIVSANEWGKYVGEAKIDVVDGNIINFDWQPIMINNKEESTFAADASISEMLAPYIAKADESLKEVIGETSDEFILGDRLTRKIETALGDMICDANLWYINDVFGQNIDFAFQNGGNIRSNLSKGTLTREDIMNVLPYDNYLYVISMKGSDIIELFNFIGSIAQGNGGFPQMSKEVRYTIDYTSGKGVMKDLTIGGAPVDANKTYSFSTNDFILNGGDGYPVLKDLAVSTFNTSLTLQTVVIEYIRSLNGIITPKLDGRITIIGGVSE